MNDKIEKLLEADGWTIECESPLEIRHQDGSFASLQAARALMQSYEQSNRLEACHAALTDIAGTAKLAQAACTGDYEKRLWNAVEVHAQTALQTD